MTEDSSVATSTKSQETEHGLRLRGAIVPVLTFLAGIGIQWFIGQQQLLHAKRETRVAGRRDYASACYHDAGSFFDFANLPLLLLNLGLLPGLNGKKKVEKERKVEVVFKGH